MRKRLKHVNVSPLEGDFKRYARQAMTDWFESNEEGMEDVMTILKFHRETRLRMRELSDGIVGWGKRRESARKNLTRYDGLSGRKKGKFAGKETLQNWKAVIEKANEKISELDYEALDLILNRCRCLQNKETRPRDEMPKACESMAI